MTFVPTQRKAPLDLRQQQLIGQSVARDTTGTHPVLTIIHTPHTDTLASLTAQTADGGVVLGYIPTRTGGSMYQMVPLPQDRLVEIIADVDAAIQWINQKSCQTN
jgi:predicted aconitase